MKKLALAALALALLIGTQASFGAPATDAGAGNKPPVSTGKKPIKKPTKKPNKKPVKTISQRRAGGQGGIAGASKAAPAPAGGNTGQMPKP